MFQRGGGGGGKRWGVIGGFAEIDLVANKDAREVWVCVFSYICEPGTSVQETCVCVKKRGVGGGQGQDGVWWEHRKGGGSNTRARMRKREGEASKGEDDFQDRWALRTRTRGHVINEQAPSSASIIRARDRAEGLGPGCVPTCSTKRQR